jgi:transcriptional regulator with PAS, ATPase and Fis domain
VAQRRPPRSLVARTENTDVPLVVLEAVRDLRSYLDEVEVEAILKARERGASPEDIARALGITRQGVYYKLHRIESQPDEDDAHIVDVPDVDVSAEVDQVEVDDGGEP